MNQTPYSLAHLLSSCDDYFCVSIGSGYNNPVIPLNTNLGVAKKIVFIVHTVDVLTRVVKICNQLTLGRGDHLDMWVNLMQSIERS